MGATGALYAWGFKYETEPGTYQMEGAVNSPRPWRRWSFTKSSTLLHAPGYTDAYMEQSLDAYKSGRLPWR
jgi:multiple sugar transport system substrate-binding protein